MSSSGTLRHGSTISHIAAVSAHEYHLHLIYIMLLTHMHVIVLHILVLNDEAVSSQEATDRFSEQKRIVYGSKKRLVRMFDTYMLEIEVMFSSGIRDFCL